MKMIKLQTTRVVEREFKLEPGWKVVQETDDPALYSPHVTFLGRKNWSEWEEKFIYRPRKSVHGKLIWGKVYRRATMNAWNTVELTKHHSEYEEQWATKKELFRWKLNGG